MESKDFHLYGKAIFFTYNISHKIKPANDDGCHLSCSSIFVEIPVEGFPKLSTGICC